MCLHLFNTYAFGAPMVNNRHKRSAASAKVIEQNKALEEELKAAREAAAKAQSSGDAAALSQMEAGPFDLPNPGGGENLANAVQFNMVPGGRCVLAYAFPTACVGRQITFAFWSFFFLGVHLGIAVFFCPPSQPCATRCAVVRSW